MWKVLTPWCGICCAVIGFLASLPLRTAEPLPALSHVVELHSTGLHNLFRISDRLFSGGRPEDEEGFASLQKLGIKTVISVDGTPPDIETARKYRLKYVHIPIGYDGIPRETMLRLAKAAKVLPGPIYIHCHHGKHRGPAAVAAVALCTDKACRASDAIAFMRRAQTDPKYQGLYAVTRDFIPLKDDELQKIPEDFPEIAKVDDLTELMSRVDQCFEMLLPLTRDQVLGNRASALQSALLLHEHFREIERLPETLDRSHEFRSDLDSSISLSELLHRDIQSDSDLSSQRQSAKLLKQTCNRCHDRDRDNR